jgi:ribosomal protein S18 acetylase RimI-like enzyme
MRDQDALTRIERETWSLRVSPSVYTPRPFFNNARPEEMLVGLLDGEVAGFLCLRPATPLASNAHVLMIAGLGVTPSKQRKGVASALLEAAETYASERKIERLTLRVLSVNTAARALYEGRGYQTEGELFGEFRLPVGPSGAAVLVDDVLMAKTIEPVSQQTGEPARTDLSEAAPSRDRRFLWFAGSRSREYGPENRLARATATGGWPWPRPTRTVCGL